MAYGQTPPRSSERIPWHPAFFQAICLELEAWKDVLEFKSGQQLAAEPLKMQERLERGGSRGNHTVEHEGNTDALPPADTKKERELKKTAGTGLPARWNISFLFFYV
ncbi:MAG: hypothetical protein LBK13_03385 [Spirochaetales bacterium]|jgi:hypothetical protein|nr:hypothetical protein [Spirochaetales bacterium]